MQWSRSWRRFMGWNSFRTRGRIKIGKSNNGESAKKRLPISKFMAGCLPTLKKSWLTFFLGAALKRTCRQAVSRGPRFLPKIEDPFHPNNPLCPPPSLVVHWAMERERCAELSLNGSSWANFFGMPTNWKLN